MLFVTVLSSLALMRVVEANQESVLLENIMIELEGGEEVNLFEADRGSDAYLNDARFENGYASPFLIND